MIRAVLIAAVLIAALAAPSGARAHSRDRVFSTWQVDGGTVTATVRLPARLVTPFGSGEGLARHFVRTMTVSLGGAKCALSRTALGRGAADGTIAADLSWTCKGEAAKAQDLVIRIDSLFERFPAHLHFARLHLTDGGMDERIFTGGDRRHVIELRSGGPEQTRPWFEVTADYVGLGVTHILAGADHLAFVLALMLLASGVRAMLFIVTGFTLGHSVTLALAATGSMAPVSGVVEALIGFTIAIVAVEASGKLAARPVPVAAAALPLAGLALTALLAGSALPTVTWAGVVIFTACYLLLIRNTQGSGWAVTLAAVFGLVHGFGFAGVLQQIGLPHGRQVAALLGFNVGVELGQIAVVAAAFAAGTVAARGLPARARPWAAQALASALCGLGTFWFVSRAFAG